MIGINTLHLNIETMRQAVEDYLNARLILPTLKVTSVKQPGSAAFVAIVESVEESD